jgi:hypothetical protein
VKTGWILRISLICPENFKTSYSQEPTLHPFASKTSNSIACKFNKVLWKVGPVFFFFFFQFCDVTQIAIIVKAKFGNIQNMKVKILSTLSYYRQLCQFLAILFFYWLFSNKKRICDQKQNSEMFFEFWQKFANKNHNIFSGLMIFWSFFKIESSSQKLKKLFVDLISKFWELEIVV